MLETIADYVEKLISKLRALLMAMAKRKKRPLSDPERYDLFFTGPALSVVKELRQLIDLDDSTRRLFTVHSQEDARKYFLSEVLDDVQSVAVAMIRWNKLVAYEVDNLDVDTERILSDVIISERGLWTRRLVEALMHTICFSSCNEESYYRHWLLIRELINSLYAKKDIKNYYNCEIKNIDVGIKMTIEEIREVEKTIDLSKCWYIKRKRSLPDNPNPADLRINFSELMSIAMKEATPLEKTHLGFSYESFSQASREIHFSPSKINVKSLEELVKSSITRCGFLTQSLLLRTTDILEVEPQGVLAQIEDAYARLNSKESSSSLVSGRARVGDYVVVGRSLARVVRITHSDFGYESYNVEYLADPPISEISSDYILPFQVIKLFDASKLKKETLERIKEVDPLANTMSDSKLKSAMDESIVEAWYVGLRYELLDK